MRKLLLLLVAALTMSVAVTSCSSDDDDTPQTNQKASDVLKGMTGKWITSGYGGHVSWNNYNVVRIYAVADDNGSELYMSSFDVPRFTIKVNADYKTMTFSAHKVDNESISQGFCSVTNGRILKGAAKDVNGQPVDSIEFDLKTYDYFDNDSIIEPYHFGGRRVSDGDYLQPWQ